MFDLLCVWKKNPSTDPQEPLTDAAARVFCLCAVGDEVPEELQLGVTRGLAPQLAKAGGAGQPTALVDDMESRWTRGQLGPSGHCFGLAPS
eukprot:g28213.t1